MATPPVRTKNQGMCRCPYVSGPQTLIPGPHLLGETALPPNRSAAGVTLLGEAALPPLRGSRHRRRRPWA